MPKIKDDVTVESKGQAISGWTAVSISQGLDRAAGSFHLTFPRTPSARKTSSGGALSPIGPLDGVNICLGDDRVLTGFVDSVGPGTDERAGMVQVSGRSKTADLVDCSSMIEPGQWKNVTVETIVKAIAAPFGVLVDYQPAPVPVKNFELEPGERVFDAIERLCRRHGFLVHDTATGALVIARPVGEKSAGALHFLYGPKGGVDPNNNVLKTSGRVNLAARFSEIIVRGQNVGTDTNFGTGASAIEGRAKDLGVTRYRPLIIQAVGRVDNKSAKDQAEWEVSRRIGQGSTLTHTVRGWRQTPAGSLWRPGLLVPVRDASIGIFDDMMVTEVEWTLDGQKGRQCRLVLQSPKAFLPKTVNVGGAALGQWHYATQQVEKSKENA